MLDQLTFYLWLNIGLIIPSGDVDGRKIYDVYDKDCNLVAEYAYRGEILNYIEHKCDTFVYNEDIPDFVMASHNANAQD